MSYNIGKVYHYFKEMFATTKIKKAIQKRTVNDFLTRVLQIGAYYLLFHWGRLVFL